MIITITIIIIITIVITITIAIITITITIIIIIITISMIMIMIMIMIIIIIIAITIITAILYIGIIRATTITLNPTITITIKCADAAYGSHLSSTEFERSDWVSVPSSGFRTTQMQRSSLIRGSASGASLDLLVDSSLARSGVSEAGKGHISSSLGNAGREGLHLVRPREGIRPFRREPLQPEGAPSASHMVQAWGSCKAYRVTAQRQMHTHGHPRHMHTHLGEGLKDKACDLLLSSCAADLLPARCRSGAGRGGPAKKARTMSRRKGFMSRAKAVIVRLGRLWTTAACVCHKSQARKGHRVAKVTSIRSSNIRQEQRHTETVKSSPSGASRPNRRRGLETSS